MTKKNVCKHFVKPFLYEKKHTNLLFWFCQKQKLSKESKTRQKSWQNNLTKLFSAKLKKASSLKFLSLLRICVFEILCFCLTKSNYFSTKSKNTEFQKHRISKTQGFWLCQKLGICLDEVIFSFAEKKLFWESVFLFDEAFAEKNHAGGQTSPFKQSWKKACLSNYFSTKSKNEAFSQLCWEKGLSNAFFQLCWKEPRWLTSAACL